MRWWAVLGLVALLPLQVTLPVTDERPVVATVLTACGGHAVPDLGLRDRAGGATLVADLKQVDVRPSRWREPLLGLADRIVTGSIPVVDPALGGQADPLRHLYDHGVALRRITGILGYAYAATGDVAYLDALSARVALNAARWPDWNPAHPLDNAQLATAVAIAYSWSRDRLSPADQHLVSGALVSRMVEPYACAGGALRDPAGATGAGTAGNQATVLATAAALAGIAVHADAPGEASAAVAAALDVLSRSRVVDGPTAEGLMYTSYEAANIALLHATLRAPGADPAVTATLAGALPSLDLLAGWTERCGLVAEPAVEDGWDRYPWVDRATGLAAIAAEPSAGPRLRAVFEGLQESDVLTVPGQGSWTAPDGLAELVLSTAPAVREASPDPSGPPSSAYVSGSSAYGCVTDGPVHALVSGAPNNAPHAHQDVGNVVVTDGEHEVLTDLGQRDYRFQGRPVWRGATRAHTTVGVVRADGLAVQDRGGAGSVSADGSTLVLASNSALPGVGWERRVDITAGSALIRDTFTSGSAVPLSLSYLLGAGPSDVVDLGAGRLRFHIAGGSTWELTVPVGATMAYSDAAPPPPYVDSVELAPLAASRTLVVVTAAVDGTLDLAAQVRRVG